MLSFFEMFDNLKLSLNEHRFVHSIGVMDTALRLGKIYGADIEKCRIAGLLHDCAKKLSVEEMKNLISEYQIELYEGEINHPQLLHAPAGVAIAKRDYGVEDAEILHAIRSHTVGSHKMSLLDLIIFVSDFIEPNRKEFDGLENVRRLSETDLNAAYCECRRLTEEYCIKNNQPVFAI